MGWGANPLVLLPAAPSTLNWSHFSKLTKWFQTFQGFTHAIPFAYSYFLQTYLPTAQQPSNPPPACPPFPTSAKTSHDLTTEAFDIPVTSLIVDTRTPLPQQSISSLRAGMGLVHLVSRAPGTVPDKEQVLIPL